MFCSQESRRGEMLVNRLMRQCQQERRIATQLMQIRKAKDVIRRNRCKAVCIIPTLSSLCELM